MNKMLRNKEKDKNRNHLLYNISRSMKLLALVSSMPFESEAVLASLKKIRTFQLAGKSVHKGQLSGRDILLVNSGIGKVNAAHTATCIMENFAVQGIVNFGVGGAYLNSGLKLGDIAVAIKEIYGDEGVAGLKKWTGMEEIGIPIVKAGKRKYFNEFTLDKKFANALIPSHPPLAKVGWGDFEIKSGAFVTVSAASGTPRKAIELEKTFHAVCENMEGAAIAQVCVIYKIPFLEIRGISNIAGVRDKKKWDLRLASANCQQAVQEILTHAGY